MFAYSPVSLMHMNAHWAYTTSHGGVVANFDGITTLTDGREILTGKAVDEYGWWHRKVTLDCMTVRNLHRAAGYPEPEPAPFRVGIRFEWRHSCLRLVIPDDAARRLRDWKVSHWTEVSGYATGYTAAAKRGSWEHRALAYIHSVQSRTDDDMPFVEGESFESMRDEHGHATPGAYDLMPMTCGVSTNPCNPTTGFHITG